MAVPQKNLSLYSSILLSSTAVDWTLLQIVIVFFVAATVRSALGFGEALIAVPLLALVAPIEVVAPVAVLHSITIAALVILQDWRHIHYRSAGLLTLTTVIGTPLGILLLSRLPERGIKLLLGSIIVAFAAFCLMRRRPAQLNDDRFAWLFGFFAGVLGGAYGMNGPPLVVYGALRGWTPQHFRATLQGYFLPASILIMVGFWLSGLWTEQVTYYYFLSLPAVIVAIFVGRFINRRISGPAFLHFVYLGLMLAGALLLGQALLVK